MRVPAAKFSEVPKTISGLRLEIAVEDALLGGRAGPAPSSRSTNSSVVACSSSARASDSDRFGRFRSSLISAPFAKLVTPKRWMKIVFGPIAPIMSRSDWSKPRMIDVMPTIDVMPMTTPRTVSAGAHLVGAHRVERHRDDFLDEPDRLIAMTQRVRSRAFTACSAVCVDRCSFTSQRLDRIEPRGLHRRIEAEEQPDQRGDADAEGDRPRLRGRPESA